MSRAPRIEECRSCGAQIIWAHSKATGKAMPVDAQPTGEGNVLLVWAGTSLKFRILQGDEKLKAYANRLSVYVSHFATCPNAKHHRKGGA